MKEKINNYLGILDNLDFDVWFYEETGSGHVTLRHHCVTSTVIDLITKAVDLVAITCIASDVYRITFMKK